jgi:D-alanyl-D-alanine carboxypeptidase
MRYRLFATFALSIAIASLPSIGTAAVRGEITVDLNTGTVIAAKNAGAHNPPASLAKVMTLYLLLEAVAKQTFDMGTPLPVSAFAAGQPATRLGLKTGQFITVREAAETLLVRSANDVAVVIAEALSTSEAAFVQYMNGRAQQLGLTRTQFGNASGLPHKRAHTTARDLALLTTALYRRFPGHADLFKITHTTFGDRQIRSHNGFVRNYPGALGLKTGFTCRAGYNTITVASRNAQRIVSVVVGASTSATRNAHARRALDKAFALPGAKKGKQLKTFAPVNVAFRNQLTADRCINGGTSGVAQMRDPFVADWSVLLEPFARRGDALKRARSVARTHAGARTLLLPFKAKKIAHRAGVTRLSRDNAIALCRKLRGAKAYCVVRSPAAMAVLKQQARLALFGQP